MRIFTRKKIIILVLVLAAIFAGRHFSSDSPPSGMQMGQMPPAEVEVEIVGEHDITIWNEFTGRLEAVENIEIRPRVSGAIEKVHFTDGQMVKKGDVLFTIDQDQFYAESARAEAQLAGARSQNLLAETELNRAKKLFAAKAISAQEYDAKKNAAKLATANLKSASAEVKLTSLNLGYSKVRAPVSGKIGRPEVTQGNLVQAGTVVLTTLVDISPIFAAFEVDENTYLNMQSPNSETMVELGLSNDAGFTYKGKIKGFDNQLNTSSGTIRARAQFDNADGKLIPGLFSRIRIGTSSAKAILVDQKAIGTDQDRKFVMVVDDKNIAQPRPVVLGSEYNGKRVITSGIAVGEKVIVNGLQKAMPGAPVKPVVKTAIGAK